MVEARNRIVRDEPLETHKAWEGRGYDLSAAPDAMAGRLESVAGLSSHANTREVATASRGQRRKPRRGAGVRFMARSLAGQDRTPAGHLGCGVAARREPADIRFEQVLPRAAEPTDQASDTETRKLNSTFPNATTSPSLSTAWATR